MTEQPPSNWDNPATIEEDDEETTPLSRTDPPRVRITSYDDGLADAFEQISLPATNSQVNSPEHGYRMAPADNSVGSQLGSPLPVLMNRQLSCPPA